MKKLLASAVGLLSLAASGAASANSDEHARTAGTDLTAVDRDISTVQAAVDKAKGQLLSVEERLANGEFLYETKDYERAVAVLSEIIEKYPDSLNGANALWLRGESYYAAHQYMSARRDFKTLIDKQSDPHYQAYMGRALGRLVDVSLRVGNLAGLDEVFQRLGEVPPAQVDAGLSYAKGKAYYAKGDYTNAQQAFQAIPGGTEYAPQAKYFLGLVVMEQIKPAAQPPSAVAANASASSDQTVTKSSSLANYRPAIDVFRQVTQMQGDTDDHKRVIDLAWMAMGRLYYEMEQYQQAADAYSHVRQESPEFDTMLYELAWVYVRQGDVQRAERALEVMQVADPTSPYVGSGTLLRADLLLRAGAFDQALQLYEGVRSQYDPMREKVEAFLGSTKDVGIYYEKLSQQQLESLDQGDSLPQLAVRWAREADDGPAAFAVIDDVNECRTLLKQSTEIAERLSILTRAANRVRAFPELMAGEERALGLLNQVSHARLEIAKGLDEEEPEVVAGELADVRARRRALMGALTGLPTTPAEFTARDDVGRKQWNEVSQKLTVQNLEMDQLQAMINGLRRLMKDDAQRGQRQDPATVAQYNAEIDQNEHDLKLFREEAEELHKQILFGREQVGLGDSRYATDNDARNKFRDLVDREVQLVVAAQGGVKAQSYGQRTQPLLMQAHSEEDKLIAAFNALDVQVDQRVKDLQARIDVERASIANYTTQLDTLDKGQNGAHELVGVIAERNFGVVRDRLRGILLRADVGITTQAWEIREEEIGRVRSLQTEKAREEQLLQEEQKEVLDDANNSVGGAK
jgi:tetratricopeptide (TPR) repeat protein